MKRVITLTLALFLAMPVFAESIQISHNGLRLNAEYNPGDDDKPIFVILHATWQHHTSELPSYLQELLDFEGYGSLAFSLSLGLDDRKVAINCDETPTVLGTHQQAVDELKLWFDWLKDKGHDRFVLVGHSRGGAQATLFWQTQKYPGIEKLILIAPATFDYESTARNFEENFRVPLAEQIAYYKKLENKTDPITESALLYCFYAKTSAETFLSYYEETPQKHTPAMLADIEIPTTVFLGSEDRLSDRFISYEMEFSDNDKVSTYWVEGADHFFRDLYADEIIEEVLYGDDS